MRFYIFNETESSDIELSCKCQVVIIYHTCVFLCGRATQYYASNETSIIINMPKLCKDVFVYNALNVAFASFQKTVLMLEHLIYV